MGYQGLSVPDLTGQFHTAQDFGFDTDFGQIQGFGRLEPSFDPLNSPDLQAIPISGLHQVLEHGLFDPLGSRFHDSSSKKRRRRYAPGKKVTKVNYLECGRYCPKWAGIYIHQIPISVNLFDFSLPTLRYFNILTVSKERQPMNVHSEIGCI